MTAPLLEVEGLRTWFHTPAGVVRAVDGVDLRVEAGEVVVLIGESGSGKSVTALSILDLVPCPPGIRAGGAVRVEGRDLRCLSPRDLRRVRGREVGMVFQDPRAALNPVLSLGRQLEPVLRRHRGLRGAAAREEGLRLLERVGIPEPLQRWRQVPHELSGGLCQRAMVALALAGGPRLLVADEPTTALDVTVQAQVLDLLLDLREREGLGILLVTHDLGVAAEVADRVVVMEQGRVVEEGPVEEVFDHPRHAATSRLLAELAPRRAS